jgi:colanic acid/amylovoran biosynthesis glycosyltransferase
MVEGAFPNLIYVCHEFPKPTETFVYREVLSLLKRGRKIKVFSMKAPRNIAQIEGAEDFLDIVAVFPKDLSWEFFKAQLKWFLKKPATYLRELLEIIGECKNKKAVSCVVGVGLFARGVVLATMLEDAPDFKFIHAPGTGDELISVHAASALTGVPYGFTLHAPYSLFIDSPLLAKHARDATWIASISKEARERLVKLAGESVRDKIGIVHCGVRIEDFQITPSSKKTVAGGDVRQKKIISIGSLVELKGHDVLIKAVMELIKRGLGIRLDIIGEGLERSRLESLRKNPNLSDLIALRGALHPKDVRAELAGSDVFALACRIDSRKDRDGVPVAIMEAMAMGLPCVSTYVSGIPELIENGVSGLLVEPDDVQALADALGKILTDSQFASKLGKAAREKIEREYTLSGQVQQLEELIIAKSKL